MNNDSTQALTQWGQKASVIVTRLLGLFPKERIADEADNVKAAQALSEVRSYRKESKKQEDLIIKPIKDHLKFLHDQFVQHDAPAEVEEKRLSGLMSTFQAEKAMAAREEAARLQKLAEAQAKRDAKKGIEPVIPEVVAPVVDLPPNKVEGTTISFTTKTEFEITDRKLIPAEFWIVDEVALGKQIRAGRKDIPGVNIWTIQIPVDRKG